MKVRCPNCPQHYEIDESFFGVEVECQNCGVTMCFEAPAEQPPPPPAPPPPPPAPNPKPAAAGRKIRVPKQSKPSKPSQQPRQSAVRRGKPKAAAKSSAPRFIAIFLVLALLLGAGLVLYQSSTKQPPVQRTAKTPNPVDQTRTRPPVRSKPDLLTRRSVPVAPAPVPQVKPVPSKPPVRTAPPVTQAPEVAPVAVAKVEFSNGKFPSELVHFFDKHCLQCHGPDKEKGGLRVDLLTANLDDQYSLSHYQNIVDELATQNMPPEEKPQPNPQEVVVVINALTELIEAAKTRHSSGGGRLVRRLTRTEFLNTSHDLLGVYADEEGLPDDFLTGTFDTNAENLFLTDMHVQAYLAKSRGLVKRFIASRNDKPGARKVPVQYSPDLMDSDFSFIATDVPPAGQLIIRSTWWQRDGRPSKPISIGPANDAIEYDILGTKRSPQAIDFTVMLPQATIPWRITQSHIPSVNLAEGLSKPENAGRLKALGKIDLNAKTLVAAQERALKHPVVLGKIETVQIVNRQPYDFFAPFLRNGDRLPDSAAKGIIRKFATLTKRGRPVHPATVETLYEVFNRGRKMGMPFWEAIEEPMAVAMCSIDAIMHFEDRRPAKRSQTVSGLELANRLSYTLWRSAPDAELVRLGRAGSLLNDQVKAQQVKRMMADKKFDRFLQDFAEQWLELPRQDEIAVDTRIYKEFNLAAKPAMKQETVQFLAHLVRENLALTNLIDSDFMVLNNTMARHYEISGVEGHQFRPVPRSGQSMGRYRGGILTHAGILMQGGTGDRTSIVERGAFIARKMIDRPPNPPPPNAGELPTEDVNTRSLTGGQLVRQHASAPQCANCHAKIDPLGMGLEAFDAVGMPRRKEVRLNPGFHKLNRKQRRNPANLVITVPIDTRGYVDRGRTFDGLDAMKRELMGKKTELATGFVKALLTYANGREASLEDQAIVDTIVKQAATKEFPTRSMIEEVMMSKAMTNY